jgi:hypothetical protein
LDGSCFCRPLDFSEFRQVSGSGVTLVRVSPSEAAMLKAGGLPGSQRILVILTHSKLRSCGSTF